MFLSQISCDFWMECCHLQELRPQGQEVGAKPGKVLAYLLCYLLRIAQQLKERKDFLRSRHYHEVKTVFVLSQLRTGTKQNKPINLELFLKILFPVILLQRKLVRPLLFVFKMSHILVQSVSKGLSFTTGEQVVGTASVFVDILMQIKWREKKIQDYAFQIVHQMVLHALK